MRSRETALSRMGAIKAAAAAGACALALALGLACAPAAAHAAGAEASVTYLGGAEKYVFAPGGMTGTDLFVGLKDAMPGDALAQSIEVRDDGPEDATVYIYLKAVAHDEQGNPLSAEVAAHGKGETVASMADFLAQLSMTVENGGEVIYEASPDQLAGLSDYVLLGAFEKGESTTLVVTLDVPIELGNEYAWRAGEVDWVFLAEEVPHPGPEPEPTPVTGDSMLPVALGIGAVALAALVLLIVASRRRKRD